MEWAFGVNGRAAALTAFGEKRDVTVPDISVFSRGAACPDAGAVFGAVE